MTTLQLTDRVDVLTQYVQGKLEDNKSYIEVQDVWLGDQTRFPRTPCLSVEPGPKSRESNGAPRRYAVMLDTYITLYVEKIQDASANTLLLIQTAERIEEVLHADNRLGGLVIESFVAQVEQGVAVRAGTELKACQLTFRSLSQKMLPYAS